MFLENNQIYRLLVSLSLMCYQCLALYVCYIYIYMGVYIIWVIENMDIKSSIRMRSNTAIHYALTAYYVSFYFNFNFFL